MIKLIELYNQILNENLYLDKSIGLISNYGLEKTKNNYKKIEQAFIYKFGEEDLDIKDLDGKNKKLQPNPLTSSEIKNAFLNLDNQLLKVKTPTELVNLISDRSTGEINKETYEGIERYTFGFEEYRKIWKI